VWGKISTFFQIAAALMVMVERAGMPAPVTLALGLMLVATIFRGFHYVWRAVGMLRQTAH
jgi:phosphatidylglycerophosphate synthase